MKKRLLYLSLLLVLLLTVLLSCEKDPILVPDKCVVELSATEGGTVFPTGLLTLKKGAEINIKTKPQSTDYKEDSIFVNGSGYPLSSGGYLFPVVNPENKVKVTFKPTLTGKLTTKPWAIREMRIVQDGMIVANLVLDAGQKKWRFSFSTDGVISMTYEDGHIDKSGKWYFSPDEKYMFMGDKYTIDSLNDTEFVFSIPGDWYHKPCMFQQVYYHVSI